MSKIQIEVTSFNSLMYEMNFGLVKQCFQTFRKKCNLHLNPFSNYYVTFRNFADIILMVFILLLIDLKSYSYVSFNDGNSSLF
jgi:hypothetical protein